MTGPDITDFDVVTEDIEGTATTVQQSVQSVEADISGLRSFVEATAEYWQGADQLAFAALMDSFDVNANNLKCALDSIAAGLLNNAGTYNDAGQQNKQSLADIHANLPPARF